MASSHVSLITAGGTSNRRIASSVYGYCTTAAATVAKEVSLYTGNSTTADGTWSANDLFHGLTITVRFQYANTASSPTLNVNGTGAKPIYRYGTTVPGTSAAASWNAQGIVTFTYDTLLNASGCWVQNDYNNSTYSAGTASLLEEGTNTTNRIWSAKILHDYVEQKQDLLVSGTNIKTINNESLLGSGNISIGGGTSDVTDVQVNGTSVVTSGIANIQDGDFMTATTRAAWDTRIGTTDATIDQMLAYIVDAMTVKSVTPTITPTASQYKYNNSSMFVYGKVVQLHFEPYCTGSVGAGDNIYRGSLTPAAYRPKSNVLSASYYNAKSYAAMLATDGTLTVRNASANSHPANASLAITFTYLIN